MLRDFLMIFGMKKQQIAKHDFVSAVKFFQPNNPV